MEKIKGTDKNLGGTMRLGSYEAKLKDDSKICKIYGKKILVKDIVIGMKLTLIIKTNLRKKV